MKQVLLAVEGEGRVREDSLLAMRGVLGEN